MGNLFCVMTLRIRGDQGRFSPKYVVIGRITMILLLLLFEVIMEPLPDFATMKTAPGVVCRSFETAPPGSEGLCFKVVDATVI